MRTSSVFHTKTPEVETGVNIDIL